MGVISTLDFSQQAKLLPPEEETEASNTVPLVHGPAPLVSFSAVFFLVIYYMGWGCFPISCISPSHYLVCI